jgi:polyhydroxyalkanoate synthesis regulator protein
METRVLFCLSQEPARSVATRILYYTKYVNNNYYESCYAVIIKVLQLIIIICASLRIAPRGTSDTIFLNILILFLFKKGETEIQQLFSLTILKTFLNNYGNKSTSIYPSIIDGSLFPKHLYFVFYQKGRIQKYKNYSP